MILSAELPDHRWINARLPSPAQPPLLTPELWVGSLLVYLFVLTAAVLIATRIARPLRNPTRAAEAFRGRNEPVTVKPSGPSDLRNTILAFNAMNERVVQLLEEKDRTLGAIGHDLRTPLASLRIRAESVEPEEDRERMIVTIEEMTETLADILTLARAGRSRRACGQEPGRQCRKLRRSDGNRGEGSAGAMIIAVLDRGPGRPEADLERVAGAFYRAEPSRNRETGGAGLGLSIAKAVADAHGGTLRIANREGGGLAAMLTLPMESNDLLKDN